MDFTWIHDHTFHHAAFADLPALVRAKQAAGVRVSLCIPTLNEAATIGTVVSTIRQELVERHPLVDEIAVIDSGSTDATTVLARAAGAEVHFSGDILPAHGFRQGKGENLWKALYQLSGDIICYLDADISNIHPRFVYGLVGPLIRHPQLQYVKACYERPLNSGDGSLGPGGGRVTEILVRPLFAMFYPELTQLLQPLAGEFAVRRCVLESLSFPTGYSVETAHLIDVYHQFGMQAFAQTDLDQRIHRNQPTEALGRMAFAILQSFLARLQQHGKIHHPAALATIFRAWQLRDGHHCETSTQLDPAERPPMLTIPEYQRKRLDA